MDDLALELMALMGQQAPGLIQKDPRDFTNQFNTALTPKEEVQFAAWLNSLSKKSGRDRAKDFYDYDLKGAWKAGAAQAGNGHFPDTFKKPNHPTFSSESQYSKGQTLGGTWKEGPGGKWTFSPSKFQMTLWSPQELKNYFSTREKDSSLILDSEK